MPLFVGQPHRTIDRVDLRSRKALALVVALVLSLGTFVFAEREAQARQLPQAQQHAAVTEGDVLETARGAATEPVAGTLPAQSPPTKTPPPAEAPPTKEPPTTKASPPPTTKSPPPVETPPTKKKPPEAKTPPPVETPPAGTTTTTVEAPPDSGPTPELVSVPSDQNDLQSSQGKPYDGYGPSSGSAPQAWKPEQTSGTPYQYDPGTVDSNYTSDQTSSGEPGFLPAPAPDSYSASPVDPSPATGPVDPNSATPAPEPVQGPVSKTIPFEENGSLPISSEGKPSSLSQPDTRPAPLPGNGPANAVPTNPPSSAAVQKPRASGPTVPGSVEKALLPLPRLEAAMRETVGTPQSPVSSTPTHAVGILAGESDGSSSSGAEGPSGGTPQPHPPLAPPPAEGSSFSLSGGGQIGAGGAAPLLLLCALALAPLRRDGKLLRVFCEVPKLSSALLAPLERPG